MTDDQFMTRFTECSLAPSEFDHLAHMRLGWICLQRHPPGEAIELACAGLARYAAQVGAPDKFHRTMTEALMRMLLACGAAERALAWPEFAARAALLAADARAQLARHYSPGLLAAAESRRVFVAPDLLPLP